MRRRAAMLSQWLAASAAAVFVANVMYFFALLSRGSAARNALTDHVVALHNHGTTVFVTHSQYDAWIGSLIVAAALFVVAAVLSETSRREPSRGH